MSTAAAGDNNIELTTAASTPAAEANNCDNDDTNEVHEHETSLTDTKESKVVFQADFELISRKCKPYWPVTLTVN